MCFDVLYNFCLESVTCVYNITLLKLLMRSKLGINKSIIAHRLA